MTTGMQFTATKRSGCCCADDDVTARGPGGESASMSLDDVTDMMKASQWCGCGAMPGANLGPRDFTGRTRCSSVRPMTLPGYGVGPHGLELGAVGDVPDVCADYPLIYQLPDSSFNLDPIDSRIWTPPATGYGRHGDSWLPWGYAPGPKV